MSRNQKSIHTPTSSETIISLSGTWQAEIPSRNLTLPMEIPGDLAGALVENQILPHPYPGKNELGFQWLGHSDWSMRTEFTLPEGTSGQPALLVLDQLDTFADIYINGKAAGSSANMFTSVEIEIGRLLNAGSNEIRIDFRGPEKEGAQEAEKLPYPIPSSKHFPWASDYRNLIRKVQCHGGWDWGPAILTSGIYGSAYIRTGNSPRISALTPMPRMIDGAPARNGGPARKDGNLAKMDGTPEESGSWIVDIEILCHSPDERVTEAALTLKNPDGKILENSSTPLNLQRGENRIVHSMEVDTPLLWWPAGEGGQSLYSVELSLEHDAITRDTPIRRRFGFRHIEVVHEDDEIGRSLKFRVNGREIFAKGANWIPVSALPSLQSEALYRNLLEDAREANMNMIRVWGGGQYEKELFYDLCDELGLLVWQDMMFACAMYPATPDFLNTVEPEIRYQVQRLKHRACVAIWCGNNEDLGALSWYEESRKDPARYLVDYDRLNEGVVGRIVRELDPSRTWWPSSPSAGMGDYSDNWHDDSKGDMHYWSVWHEGKPFEAYYDVTPRFCSEFGFQSFPSLETVKTFADQDEWNISSPVMRHHQRNDRGNSIILSTMSSYFRIPDNFEDQLYVSQVQQAMAIRTAVEYWRSRRPVSMGALYWQLNDNWPVASWASIEYGGRWKVLHYEARRFFARLSPVLYSKDGSIYCHIINDLPEAVSGTMLIRRISFSGEILESIEAAAEVNGGSAKQVWEHPAYGDDEAANSFLHTVWTVQSKGLKNSSGSSAEPSGGMETSMFLARPRDCYLEPGELKVSPGSSAHSIRVESDVPAFYVTAELPASAGLPGHFSDGGFTLLPGEPRELKYTHAWSAQKGCRPDVKISPDMVRIRHLRETY